MVKQQYELTFTESCLGTAPNNEEIYTEYIASKAPDAMSREEEIESVGLTAYTEKGITVYNRDLNGNPALMNYHIKGFFKDACSMLNKLTPKDPTTGKKAKATNESSKLKAYKKIIDGLIFVEPRFIPFDFEGEVGLCQRPLRAQTMQGERVALAISEEIPKGAKIRFTVYCFDESLLAAVDEWMDYGYFRGISQWRNSGKGTFTYKKIGEPEYGDFLREVRKASEDAAD